MSLKGLKLNKQKHFGFFFVKKEKNQFYFNNLQRHNIVSGTKVKYEYQNIRGIP
jgi:hypothetical protein